MPAIPQQLSSHSIPQFTPADPNRPLDSAVHHDTPSHQAAPGITATASHLTTHVLPRRFLGQMPEAVVNSAEVEERHKHLMGLRSAAMRRISSAAAAGSKGKEGLDNRRKRVLGRLKEIRGLDAEGENGVVDLDDEDEDEMRHRRWHVPMVKGKKKQKRKDVWLGESFDIGREFRSAPVREVDDQVSNRDAVRMGDGDRNMPPTEPVRSEPDRSPSGSSDLGKLDGGEEGPDNPERPAPSRGTTQESFVTARTRFSDARSSMTALDNASGDGSAVEHEGEVHELNGLDPHGHQHPQPSLPPASPGIHPTVSHQSGSSSMHPLISGTTSPVRSNSTGSSTPRASSSKHAKSRSLSPTSPRQDPSTGLKSKLKSALRRPSGVPPFSTAHTELLDTDAVSSGRQRAGLAVKAQRKDPTRAKTVQFPVDLQDAPGVMRGQIRKGNKRPADPNDVLNREGDDMEGTSAAAVEEAMAEEEEEEHARHVIGGVMMRDRVLVKVGTHKEDGLTDFTEATHRRKPARLEQIREYIIVWRRGRVELYEEWSTAIKDRIKGHKKLAYMIPLLPTRSSLAIFNPIDFTLSLTTSASKLSDDFSHVMRSETASTRTSGFRDRVKESRQGKWLRSGHRGTIIFIIKFAERSRAMDWYWELWREMDGELPSRVDIAVPVFSSTIRLNIPDDADGVGGQATGSTLSVSNITRLAREAVSGAVDTDRLMRQRSKSAPELDLQIAWKSIHGQLEWVNWDTTVQNRKRDWAVMVGIAANQGLKVHNTLQLRQANHRAKALKLQDGTVLDEPPGVEGYLTRHTGGSTPKESIYASTHDGYIFISSRNQAQPPLDPGREGATPSDLFPDVYDAFDRAEKRRMARMIEHCTGCVDLRDIKSVRLLSQVDHADQDEAQDAKQRFKGKNLEQWFELRLVHGHDAVMKTVVVEATSEETAREWVQRLSDLAAYWRHRHRVDARLRMDVEKMNTDSDPFLGTILSNQSDALLSDVWDWCVLKGCRPVCLSGRLFLRKGKWAKFRSRLIVLTGGCLVAFKIRSGEPLCSRKQRYPLYGAYTYSGLLAQSELHDSGYESAFTSEARVYQDGLQNNDDLEDRTFCVRLAAKPSYWGKKDRTFPWHTVEEKGWTDLSLSDQAPFLLVFRARSKLERDRWIWAINAEMERAVRAHVKAENLQRNYGKLP